MAGSQKVGARSTRSHDPDTWPIEMVLAKAGLEYIEPLDEEQAETLRVSLGEQLDRLASFHALELEGERPDAPLHPSATMREHIESL